MAVGDLTAEFEMRQHRGRDRDTYRPLGQAHSYPLKPESVNVERTLELLRERDQAEARTQPEHSGGAEKMTRKQTVITFTIDVPAEDVDRLGTGLAPWE